MFDYESLVNSEFYNNYEIKKGDTLYKISSNYGTNPKLLAELNGLNLNDYIYPGDIIKIPLKNVKYYITKENDTLRSVSNVFGKDVSDIVAVNKSIYLLPGQMIFYKEK